MRSPKVRCVAFLALGLILTMRGGGLSAQTVPDGHRPADDPDVQAAKRLFTAWMDGQIAYRGLPGVVVGVVAEQDLIWAQGFGFADLAAARPMTPQTPFRMASHSKLFTATAMMQLREQGELRLDDPVAMHLPWFEVKSEPDSPPITIEQLLIHASGCQGKRGHTGRTSSFLLGLSCRG